jgi:hypothetical protein
MGNGFLVAADGQPLPRRGSNRRPVSPLRRGAPYEPTRCLDGQWPDTVAQRKLTIAVLRSPPGARGARSDQCSPM